MSEPVVMKVTELTKHYGDVRAVQGVSFTVHRGEVIGFVGLNGAGKSTTINMLMGFQKPTEGKVELFGEEVSLANAHHSHRTIGFSTGDMALFDGMTGRQYLQFVARSYGASLGVTFDELVKIFEPQLDRKLRTLSRGNRQKIALIAAFMTDAELVILDEPSSGLDPLMQQRFLELVRARAAEGSTIFMSSHYLNEIAEVCTRVLLIKNGSLVKDIQADALLVAAGKHVIVTTKREINAPKGVEMVEKDRLNDGKYRLSFVTHEPAIRLQSWLSGVPNLVDISISDHDAEATFDELYAEEEEGDV